MSVTFESNGTAELALAVSIETSIKTPAESRIWQLVWLPPLNVGHVRTPSMRLAQLFSSGWRSIKLANNSVQEQRFERPKLAQASVVTSVERTDFKMTERRTM